jgi:branched-chain amino acid transport system substrate-binding protein
MKITPLRTLAVAVSAASALVLSACGSGSSANGDFQFGVVAATSGGFAKLGTDISQGIKMAVAEHGDAKAVFCDSAGDSAQAASCARKLSTEDSVPAMLAPLSIEAFPVMSFNAVGKSPFILVSASASDKFVKGDNPLVARYWFNVSTYMPNFAKLLGESVKADGLSLDVGVMQSEDEYGEAWVHAFEPAWKKAGGTVDVAKFPTNATDVYPQLTSLLKSKPAVIAVPGACGTITPAVKQARELGFKGPFVFAVSCTPAEITAAVGEKSVEGSYFESSNFDLGSKAIEKFKADYKKKYGEEPGILPAAGYSQAMWLMHAADEAGDVSDAKAIRAAMPKVLDGDWNLLAISDMQENGEVTAPIHVRIYKSADDITDYTGENTD